MADIEKVLQELPAISEMLYQMYKDETDKESISVRYYQYIVVDDTIELLKSQKAEIDRLKAEKIQAFDYLFSKFAGHSNYHGDSVLCAIEAVKEGKKIETVKTMDEDGECEKNCLTCQNSFSDEEDHLHCMAEGHNHEEIVADGHVCEQWS